MKYLFFIPLLIFAKCTNPVVPPTPNPTPINVDSCAVVYRAELVNIVKGDMLEREEKYGTVSVYSTKVVFEFQPPAKSISYNVVRVDTVETGYCIYTLELDGELSVYKDPWERGNVYTCEFLPNAWKPENYYLFELCTKTKNCK